MPMRGRARSSVNDGGTGTGVQRTFGRGFGLRLTGGLGLEAATLDTVLDTLGGLGSLRFLGASGICLPLPGSIPVILTLLSSMTATESAPVFFAARVRLLAAEERVRNKDPGSSSKRTQ